MESEEANYQMFSDSKTAMRRAIAEQVFNLNLWLNWNCSNKRLHHLHPLPSLPDNLQTLLRYSRTVPRHAVHIISDHISL